MRSQPKPGREVPVKSPDMVTHRIVSPPGTSDVGATIGAKSPLSLTGCSPSADVACQLCSRAVPL
ncbi:MAG: hypothetical protein AAFR42_02145 [Cyanobacteria bacterium J06628_6]